jgi:hypothetical protein
MAGGGHGQGAASDCASVPTHQAAMPGPSVELGAGRQHGSKWLLSEVGWEEKCRTALEPRIAQFLQWRQGSLNVSTTAQIKSSNNVRTSSGMQPPQRDRPSFCLLPR